MPLIHRGSVNYHNIDILADNINQKNRQKLKKRDVECKRWGSVVERNEKFMESLWQTDPPSRDEPQECSAEKYGSDAKTIVASVFCLTAFKCNNGKDCNETYSLVPYLYTTCTRH